MPGVPPDLLHYTDPLPQALVLTAIVIGFAMTALFLVVLLASRGLTGTDHVDGDEERAVIDWLRGDAAPDRRAGPAAAARPRRVMLLLGDERRRLQGAGQRRSRALLGLLLAVALLRWVDAHRRRRRAIGVYLPGNWQVPFGIVLVVDRLSALMLVLTGVVGARASLLFATGALGPRRRALPPAVPAPADGPERRLPDRRPVQPVRVLRGAAGRVVRPAAARLGRRARAGRPALHRRSTCWRRRCS